MKLALPGSTPSAMNATFTPAPVKPSDRAVAAVGSADTVLVSQLWAAPRQRGRGLGRELMNAVTRWAEDRRAARICLGVTESNLGVLAFYERLGYADTGIRMPLVPNHKLQVVVMARPLGS